MITLDARAIEARLLEQLEQAVRKMFKFTGWDQECDEEPAEAARDVEEALRNIDEFRRIIERATAGKRADEVKP